MKALLIISHGSRRKASNDEVFALTETLREQARGQIPLVACAFLEIAHPTVQDAINQLVEQGADEIQIFPHFLAAGTHVTRDIPRELDAAAARHPNVAFSRLPHLGAMPGIPNQILNLLKQS